MCTKNSRMHVSVYYSPKHLFIGCILIPVFLPLLVAMPLMRLLWEKTYFPHKNLTQESLFFLKVLKKKIIQVIVYAMSLLDLF